MTLPYVIYRIMSSGPAYNFVNCTVTTYDKFCSSTEETSDKF